MSPQQQMTLCNRSVGTPSAALAGFGSMSDVLPFFLKLRELEIRRGADEEPFRTPLFSANPAKRRVYARKYDLIWDLLAKTPTHLSVLDVGTGFGALLPVLSKLFVKVTAIEAFDDQLRVARDLVAYFGLTNVSIRKVTPGVEFTTFPNAEFSSVVAADVLEHMRHWKSAILEVKRILKPGGQFVVSLPREHSLYRLFARREVEHDEVRGHVYHSSKGADQVEGFLSGEFDLEQRYSVYGFFHVMSLKKRSE